MEVQQLLDSIDLGRMALPEFQRGYVWNGPQVRDLMRSLYLGYPVGSLLVWQTATDNVDARGDQEMTPGTVELLLDGQQRITSLYGIIKGKAPQFFEGDTRAFTNLRFHLESEAFEFHQPVKMKDDPLWIDVTALFQKGLGHFISELHSLGYDTQTIQRYIDRAARLENIRKATFHLHKVIGDDKTVDVVVDIFNKVNSGGTRLSKGDLALAKICASWPDARAEMNMVLGKWQGAGYWFKLEWLLRNVNCVMNGDARFAALAGATAPEVKAGLQKTERRIDTALNYIASRLGLDHDRVLGSRGSIPLMVRYLELRGGEITDPAERDRLLYWYLQTMFWGRYAGSTETKLAQDLAHLEPMDGALDRLIGQLMLDRSELTVRPSDFDAWKVSARFYPVLYLLTRTCKARDWMSGVELSSNLLGKTSRLDVHHIFPKSLLKGKYSTTQVNALANFTFLTQTSNLKISNKQPHEYLAEIEERHPGVLASHWIPMDQELWHLDRYLDFLAARRELLAVAANGLLDDLRGAPLPEAMPSAQTPDDTGQVAAPGDIKDGDEQETLERVNAWLAEAGLPAGEFSYEVIHPTTEQTVAIADLAWPEGMQQGLSQPVALLLDEDSETAVVVNESGYRYFTDAPSFIRYVEQEVLALV